MDITNDRRQLLIAAAAGSVASFILSDEASAIDPPVQRLQATPLQLRRIDAIDVRTAAFDRLKVTLKELGAWPEAFETSYEKSGESKLKQITEREKITEPNSLTHNPRLVEPLLGEIAALVDRCLAYRKEGAELEIQGIAAGIKKVQAEALSEVDKKLASSNPSQAYAAVLAANYPKAEKLFGQAGALGSANAAKLSAEIAASAKLRDSEKERIELALGRLTFVQGLEKQSIGRFEVSGNAHNFAQRFERARKLYVSDVTSAYRRAIAAAVGLRLLFGYVDPNYTASASAEAMPNPSTEDFLDDLAIWTRDAMRAVAHVAEREIEVVREVLVPVTGPEITLDLSNDEFFGGLECRRLASIGASFVCENEDLSSIEKSNASFGLVLVPAEKTQLGPEPVIILPAVRAYGSQRTASSVDGAIIQNIDPRLKWKLRLSSEGITSQQRPIKREGWITGLIVQFRLNCCVSTKVDGTWWLSQDRI